MFGLDLFAVAARRGINNVWSAAQSFASGLIVPKDVATGIKVDLDDPQWGWADMLGAIDNRSVAGGANPTWAVYRGGIYQYSFGTAAGVTETFINYHMGHDFIPGTDMYIHAHWSTAAAPTGTCNWLFEACAAVGYDRDVFEGTDGSASTITVSAVGTPTGAYRHMISETLLATAGGLVNPLAGTTYSITSGAAVLSANQSVFTAADIGRSVRVIGAGAAGANLDTTVSAYTSGTQVTLAANAGTTLTNSANAFRYRVLDSNHMLEPDALILSRCWRDSARAADTLSVAPFLHFSDCHYQSNGVVGTRGRNYPFYG